MLHLWYACFFSTEKFYHPFPHPTLRPIKDIKQWFCPRVFIPANYLALTETWDHTLLPFWGQNSENCHKCLYVRKTLCLPFLCSFGSLSLLILCIQNHPRAEIYLLVLQLFTKLKLADGFNVLHMDINLQKVLNTHLPLILSEIMSTLKRWGEKYLDVYTYV